MVAAWLDLDPGSGVRGAPVEGGTGTPGVSVRRRGRGRGEADRTASARDAGRLADRGRGRSRVGPRSVGDRVAIGPSRVSGRDRGRGRPIPRWASNGGLRPAIDWPRSGVLEASKLPGPGPEPSEDLRFVPQDPTDLRPVGPQARLGVRPRPVVAIVEIILDPAVQCRDLIPDQGPDPLAVVPPRPSGPTRPPAAHRPARPGGPSPVPTPSRSIRRSPPVAAPIPPTAPPARGPPAWIARASAAPRSGDLDSAAPSSSASIARSSSQLSDARRDASSRRAII